MRARFSFYAFFYSLFFFLLGFFLRTKELHKLVFNLVVVLFLVFLLSISVFYTFWKSVIFSNGEIRIYFLFFHQKIEIDDETRLEMKWRHGPVIGPVFLVIKRRGRTFILWNIYTLPINKIYEITRVLQ